MSEKYSYTGLASFADYKRVLEEKKSLELRIAELEEKQRWIPVSERLPELQKDNDALKKRVETLQIYADDYWERLKAHRKITRSLNARIAELEAFIERLIEAGRMMKQPETIEEFHRGRRDYNALVAKWKESERW
jgi:predicted  nucleic acid-binding Zn-ribbon protein